MRKAKVIELPPPGSRARKAARRVDPLQERVRALEEELRQAREKKERPEGLLLTLARLAQAGLSGVSWANVARLQKAKAPQVVAAE